MKLAVSGITSIFFVQSWMSVPAPNGVTWTISTLMGFYVLTPVAIPLVQRIPPRHRWYWIWAMYFIQGAFFAIAFVDVSSVVDAYWWARAWPPIRLPVYLMGVFAALDEIDPPGADPDAEDPESCFTTDGRPSGISRMSNAPRKTRKSAGWMPDVYTAAYVVIVLAAMIASSGLVMNEEVKVQPDESSSSQSSVDEASEDASALAAAA
eukprot:scaffold680898_cov41-Prasinocladus_malaysianus.AAC.1